MNLKAPDSHTGKFKASIYTWFESSTAEGILKPETHEQVNLNHQNTPEKKILVHRSIQSPETHTGKFKVPIYTWVESSNAKMNSKA